MSGILGAKLMLPVNEVKIVCANLCPKMLYRRVIGVQRESCFSGLVIRNRRQTQMRLLSFLQWQEYSKEFVTVISWTNGSLHTGRRKKFRTFIMPKQSMKVFEPYNFSTKHFRRWVCQNFFYPLELIHT